MTLVPGTRLGPYDVTALIGAGGMGEVYAATDTRLGRSVAIKILPPEVGADSDRRARFEREARTVGALSHPNIVAIHDVGTTDDVTFLVMELLEGETLRARLSQTRPTPTPGPATPPPAAAATSVGSGAKRLRGGLPVQKALDLAAQVAQGLAAAHARGIVHRDLKPENIFLTTDGRVKVLDFGLARGVAGAGANAETRTTPAQVEAGATHPGMVLGTAGYMAPEQVRGREADHRADIFALGAVLYEMLTGARAFVADSAIETMSAILSTDPLERRDVVAGLPMAVEGLVRHCLEKQPDERFQSARDLAFQLGALAGGPAASDSTIAPPVLATRRSGLRLWLGALALPVLGTAVFLAGRWTTSGPSTFDLGLPDTAPIAFVDSTAFGVEYSSLTASRQGDFIVYVARRGENTELWYRSLVGGEGRQLPGTEGAHSPALSEDGRLVAFLTGQSRVKVVAVDGRSAPRDLAEVRFSHALLWNGADELLVEHEGTTRIDVATRRTQKVANGGCKITDLLPDKKTLLCSFDGILHELSMKALADNSDDSDALPPVTIGGDPATRVSGAHAKYFDGRIVYVTNAGELAGASFNAATGAVGSPLVLVPNVRRAMIYGSSHYDITAAGDLIYVPGSNGAIGRFVIRGPDGVVRKTGLPEKEYLNFAVSRDDRWIATTVRAGIGMELWLHDLGTGRGETVASGYEILQPVWTPAGRLVYGTRKRQPDKSVRFVIEPGQGRPPEPLTGFGAAGSFDYVTDDLLVQPESADLSIHRRGVDPVVLKLPGNQWFPLVSPDQPWITYTSNHRSNETEVFVSPFPALNQHFPVSGAGGSEAVWLPGGALVYRVGQTWYRMRPDASRTPPWKEAEFFFTDDRMLNTSGLSNRALKDGSILYLQTVAPTTGGYVRVVRRFLDSLRARVPKG